MKRILVFFLSITLIGCHGKNANSVKTEKPTQIVLNVNYSLQPNFVKIYKEYENQLYTWEYPYNAFYQILSKNRLDSSVVPTNYTLSTESDYYGCYNIFYNYTENCVIVEYR